MYDSERRGNVLLAMQEGPKWSGSLAIASQAFPAVLAVHRAAVKVRTVHWDLGVVI